MIRRATAADVPFLLDVARHCYAAIEYDERAGREMLARAVAHPSIAVFRGERSGAVVALSREVWGGPLKAYIMFIAAIPGAGMIGEGVALVRAADAWRRAKGASELRFGEDTGINLAPLARRVGAVQDRPSYVIRGGEAQAESTDGAGISLLDRVLHSPGLLSGRPALRVVGE